MLDLYTPLILFTGFRLPGQVYSDPFDGSGAGIEYFKPVAERMIYHFPDLRDPSLERKNQSPHSINVFIPFITQKVALQRFFQFFNRKPGIGLINSAADEGQPGLIILIIFIFDLADNLFHQVFNRHQTIGSALFVRHQGRLLRPWITAWQDLKTRAIVGLHISIQPNSWTIALALRHAVLPKPEGDAFPMMGAPERVYIDNGKDFTSHHFGGAQKRFKVDFNGATRGVLEALRVQRVTHARPYTPWSKTVERWFGTLTRDLIQGLPGWCGNKPENRPEKLERELAGAHLLCIEEVRGAVVEWLIKDYHARAHSGQGMGGKSPLGVWLGTDRVIREFDPKVLDLLLMKAEARTIRPDGIHLSRHRYWADELALYVGERVDVRHSPDEVGRILVFRGRQFLCEAFEEKLYTFNASAQDLKAIRARQKRAERNLVEAREELVARAA
ncbi:MAG: transposase, partial [Proteobacteria bacterium]|nr:transposase [Pseudomonadota bacterium]